jgi:thioredoxin reductase
VSVVLVDERAKLGGQYYKQPPNFETDERLDAQFIAGHNLIEAVKAAGVHVLSATRLWSAEVPSVDGNGEPVLELFAAGETQRWIIRPRRLVLATGAYEKVLPFPGWTLPGVMSTGAGQSLVRAYRVAPGQRVLVAGNGPLNMQLAAELTRSGAEVVALAELARFTSPRHAPRMARMALAAPSLVRDGAGYVATLRRGRVPTLSGYTVTRAEGKGRVERVTLARIGPDGIPVAGSERGFEVDAVCLGFGFFSGNEIARLLGIEHILDAASGSYMVKSRAHGRTDIAGVWAVGDGAQVRGAKVAERMGSLAGADVALDLGYTPDAAAIRRDEKVLARHERFQEALWQVYAGPQVGSQLAEPETLICRCESVTLGAIDASLDDVCSAGALKRLTRVGMGRCQGRFCGPTVIDRVAQATGEPVTPLSGFAPQPPFRPVPAGLIAADE